MENNETKFPAKSSNMEERRLLSILAYVPFLCVVIYILKDKDEAIRFHARQGIIIFFIFVLCIIPVLGIVPLIVSVILMLIGMSKAYKGEQYKIPYVYKYSERINF